MFNEIVDRKTLTKHFTSPTQKYTNTPAFNKNHCERVLISEKQVNSLYSPHLLQALEKQFSLHINTSKFYNFLLSIKTQIDPTSLQFYISNHVHQLKHEKVFLASICVNFSKL